MVEKIVAASVPPVVVLIPTHNRLKLLERTVDSVLACTPPQARRVRLVVVENGGRFGVEELLSGKTGWVRPEYHYSEKPNKSEALNSAIAPIGDSLIVFLDDDVRVHKDLLVAYSEAAGGEKGGKFFGGGMLVDYEINPPEWLLNYLPPSAKGWLPESYSGVSKDLAFMGCNWAAFHSDIKNAGGFNPEFGPGGVSGGTGQERAMQMALMKGGVMPQYVQTALVWHYVPASRCSQWWALKRSFRNAITYGYEMKLQTPKSSVNRVPQWLLKKAMRQCLMAAMAIPFESAQARFLRMRDCLETLGNIEGVRSRRFKSIGSEKN